MTRRLRPLLLVGSLAACGARTSLRVDAPDARAVPDASRPDAAADAPRPVDAPGPVDLGPPADAPRPACTWTSTPPVALTAGDRDRSPQAVRVLDDRLWVGFQSSNPDPPGNLGRFVRVTDALGAPVAPAVEVLPSPGPMTSHGPLSLWTDPLTRAHAAMAWTEGLGCRAVALDDDARPVGASVRVDRGPVRPDEFACASVVRHPGGWTFLSRGRSAGAIYNRFRAAAPDGRETAAARLTPDAPIGETASRLVFDDGSFLFAWAMGPAVNHLILLQRFNLLGRTIAPGRPLSPVYPGRSIGALRFAVDGASVLVGWSETGASGVDFVVARTDLDGALRVAPTAVGRAPAPAGRASEFGLAVAQGVPGVVWNPSASGDDGALRLTTLDPATLRPRGAADVATARFPRNVFLRGTSMGFVAVFGAIAPPTLTQVWTAPFPCVAPP